MTLLALFFLAFSIRQDSRDREWSLRIRQGDTTAFNDFFDTYRDTLFSFLLSKGTPRDEAEDIIQQVFLTLWQNRSSIDPDKSLKSYVYRIAYNRMLNYFRDRKDTDPEYAYRLEDQTPGPHYQAEISEALGTMQKTLEKMPHRRRTVFELCYLEGFSYREAAGILDISPKTIENHMIQALKDLRKALRLHHPE